MKKIISLLLAMALVFGLVACGAKNETPVVEAPAETAAPVAATEVAEETPETRIVVDRYGREVEIPYEVETIVCLGSGAPRIAAYLQVTDMMIGVEDCDTGDVTVLRDYSWVYHDQLKDRPSCGSGGGSGGGNSFAGFSQDSGRL